jgi:hypothetical protein
MMTEKKIKHGMSGRSMVLAAALWTVMSLGAGCGPRDEVRVRQVPKESRFELPVQNAKATEHQRATPVPARMLAAMVQQPTRVWFFKMVGSPDGVRAQRGEFRKLLESLTFDAEGEPRWDLPESWTEQPGSGMRKATFRTSSAARSPSISVISLTAPQDVLSNVNRWRDQLQLPPLEAGELADQVDTFDVAGSEVTLADIFGTVQMAAAGGGPMAAAPRGAQSTNPALQEFTYQAPAEWSQAPASGMRKAAFAVKEGDNTAEVTVISLPSGAGQLLPNVNRWRGQLGLDPLEESEVMSIVRAMQIDETDGHYIQRMAENPAGTGQATIAAMVLHGGTVWFFKLTGDDELVQQEEANFEKFLDSVKFAN